MLQKINITKQVFLFLLLLTASACSLSKDKDIIFIRHNLEDFSTDTIPFEEDIEFTLSTEEILRGVEEPKLLEKVHDTEIYLVKAQERKSQKNRYVIQFGLDSEVNQSKGTMLSLFRLNNNKSYSRDLKYEVFNEKGETGNFGHGGGDGGAPHQQSYHFATNEAELLKGEKWSFKISGLYLLSYTKN